MWKSSDIQPDAETGLYYYGARYYDPSAALWLGVDPLAEKYPGVSPYVYCHGNPVRLIDPTGMEDEEANSMTLDKMYPNMLNEVVVQGEGSHQQQFDQPYGETNTLKGSRGPGVDATCETQGPNIEVSEFSYSFSGCGSKGMEWVYNMVSRIGQLVENMFGGNGNSSVVSGEKGAHYSVIKNESDIEEYIKYYPVIQGSYNDNGIIRSKNIPTPDGRFVNEGDTVGCVRKKIKRQGTQMHVIEDTTMYMNVSDTRKLLK